MRSKLFTPNASAQCPVDGVESAARFVNPPTHPEVPVFYGPTDKGGVSDTLKLGAAGRPITPTITRRPVTVRDDIDPE